MEVSIVQGWLSYLQKAVPAGFAKEKILDLFRRFNIIFISGRLEIDSDDRYTIAFLKYLSAQLGAGDTGISKQLYDHASITAAAPVAGMRGQEKLIRQALRPLILQLQERNLVDEGIRKNEENLLSAALNEAVGEYHKRQQETLRKQSLDKKKKEQEEGQKKFNEFQEDNSESIYIANAGLILFHPFLQTFFSRTGLMQNGQFNDIDSRNRAVLLLQYLANGKTAYEEHELVLNKILCDVPVEEAIPVMFSPTEQEVETSEELFRVFIERWPKIKNSSMDGLRASFILRAAMLKFIDGNWSMKVEQKGYDILLQSYPWTFGYIKTSWMQNTIIVEWI